MKLAASLKKPVIWVSGQSDTNRAVQPQLIASCLKFRIGEVERSLFEIVSLFCRITTNLPLNDITPSADRHNINHSADQNNINPSADRNNINPSAVRNNIDPSVDRNINPSADRNNITLLLIAIILILLLIKVISGSLCVERPW